MIDSLVRIVDFLFQGILVLILSIYALRDPKWFATWKEKLGRLFEPRVRARKASTRRTGYSPEGARVISEVAVLVAVAAGALYALGIVTNSLAYAVLQPAHKHIVNEVISRKTLDVPFSPKLAIAPITRQANAPDGQALVASICEEDAWLNANHEATTGQLGSLFMQLRVYRGALFFLLMFALISMVRVVISLIERAWLQGRKDAVCCILGLALYSLCMWAWAGIEADYHLHIYFGARTASKDMPGSPLKDVCGPLFASNENNSREHKILLVSDLHFNPFLDSDGKPFDGKGACLSSLAKELAERPAAEWTSTLIGPSRQNVMGTYGQDTNYALLRSSLREMHEKTPDPSLVIVSGDLLVHRFSDKFKKCVPQNGDFEDFAGKTMQFLARQFRETFPRTQVLLALGNNDTLGHYTIDPNTKFLSTIKESWSDLMQMNGGSVNLNVFDDGGYYTAKVGLQPNVTVIVANTTVWSCSFNYQKADGCSSDSAAGEKELAWLRGALQEASTTNRRVWIVGHIPPGIDVFATKDDSKPKSMYQQRFTTEFVNMLTDFGSVIHVGVFGHIHSNEFRLLDAGRQNVPLQLVPSISPSNNNNPSFLVLTVDENFSPKNYAAYFLNLDDPTAWKKEYEFQETYHRPRFSGPDLLQLSNEIPLNASMRESYRTFFASSNSHNIVMDTEWRRYWCSLTNLSPESYTQCSPPRKYNVVEPQPKP